MTIARKSRFSFITLLLLCLGACSSSDSVKVEPTSADNTAGSGEQDVVEPAAVEPQSDSPEVETAPESETDLDNDIVPDSETGQDDDIVPDDDNVTDDSDIPVTDEMDQDEPTEDDQMVAIEPPPAPGTVETDNSAPGDDDSEEQEEENQPISIVPPAPPGGVSDDEPSADETDNNGILVPPAADGSDLDRLIRGLKQQASLTLLSLNQRISEGVELSELENECLGSYEEGLGQPLTRIDCGNNSLVTEANPMAIGQTAFYDTAECQASLFDGNSDDCILQQMTLEIPAAFDGSSGGAPRLLYPGAEVAYAIDGTSLKLENNRDALQGQFSCEIDLETAQTANADGGNNCDKTVNLMADEIERLQD
ncbi:MAG: hypothetical protein AB8B97_19780 [Granulosicoccus sp.]